MRPTSVTKAGTGNSDPIILDAKLGYGLGLRVLVSGTVNYTVNHTFDNLFNVSVAAATWENTGDSSLVAASATADSNYAFVPFAVRVTNNSGAGTTTLTVIPMGQHG